MYVYGCLLLPAIKQIILKELATCMSLALLYGYSYVLLVLDLSLIKPQQWLRLPVHRSGARSQQPDGGQHSFKQLLKLLLILFHSL